MAAPDRRPGGPGPAVPAPPEPASAAPAAPAGPRWKGSDFYGSSDDFRVWLKEHRPELVVDERSVIPLVNGWHPEPGRRRKGRGPGEPAPPCPVCGGVIPPGSDLYCPECHASGYDDRLARQLAIVGRPPPQNPYRASPATVAKAGTVARAVLGKAAKVVPGLTRRARRALLYGPPRGRPSAGPRSPADGDPDQGEHAADAGGG